jgi:hypothetical protein
MQFFLNLKKSGWEFARDFQRAATWQKTFVVAGGLRGGRSPPRLRINCRSRIRAMPKRRRWRVIIE